MAGPSVPLSDAGSAGGPEALVKFLSLSLPPAGLNANSTRRAEPMTSALGTPPPKPPRHDRESWLLSRLSPSTHTSSGPTL